MSTPRNDKLLESQIELTTAIVKGLHETLISIDRHLKNLDADSERNSKMFEIMLLRQHGVPVSKQNLVSLDKHLRSLKK